MTRSTSGRRSPRRRWRLLKRVALPAALAAGVLLIIPGIAGSRSGPPPTRAVILGPFPFACEMVDEGSEARVYCWEGTRGDTRHVLLDPAGQVSLTATEPVPSGIGGPGLPYGGWLTIGRFRCEVLHKGIECVLISSGKGFLITRTSIVDVQSAPGITEPAPVFGKTAAVESVSGSVLVKEPHTKFTRPLNVSARVPMGSILDTTNGTVQLSTAKGIGGEIQTGRFKSGLFKVTQPAGKSAANLPEGLTVLTLLGPRPPDCRGRVGRRPVAESSAKRSKSRLWGDAHGDFQTGGRYATVTVRGTRWLTEDTCRGTLVKVARGTVQVDDLINHRSVSVTAGHSYLASASVTPKNKVPVLGHPMFRTRGLGRVRPDEVNLGGDARSVVKEIHWDKWGSPRAVGDGIAWYIPRSVKSVSEGHAAPAKIVAFDLGICDGKLAYRQLEWFFPSDGGHFIASRGNSVCI